MCTILSFTGRVAIVLGLLCGVAHAQSCALPTPLQAKFENFGHLDATDPGTGCRLTAMVNASAPRLALAYAYYRRPPSSNPLRFGFHIDTSGLTGFSSVLRNATIFSATARNSFPATDGTSQLLQMTLFGNAGAPILRIVAADNAQAAHAQVRSITLSQSVATVRIELTRGIGGPGLLRYWIDANYTDPPTGIIESSLGTGLDNSEWGPIESVALGLGEMSNGFRANQANMPLVFDQIQTDDEFIFFNGFE